MLHRQNDAPKAFALFYRYSHVLSSPLASPSSARQDGKMARAFVLVMAAAETNGLVAFSSLFVSISAFLSVGL